jgi:hypothetical protein
LGNHGKPWENVEKCGTNFGKWKNVGKTVGKNVGKHGKPMGKCEKTLRQTVISPTKVVV